MDYKLLEDIGLTKSETKVYLALFKLGSTSKSPLVKVSGISSSKIYEITDKLINKGLVSYVLINKVKYFKAAPPGRLREYLKEKKKKIEKQEENLDSLIFSLDKSYNILASTTSAEIFEGWRGMETVFEDLINTLKKGETTYVFGASKGMDSKKTQRFYSQYMDRSYARGIKVKIVMNEDSREYYKTAKGIKKHVKVRFLKQTTPAEINISKEKVLIIILKETPLVIRVNSKEVASSFKQYFDVMWKQAKP